MVRRLLSITLLLAAFAVAARAQMAGDANCDGSIDPSDLAVMATTLFAGAGEECAVADVNGDGLASAADLSGVVGAMAQERRQGPVITFFGLGGASGAVLNPLGSIGKTPVYFRTAGSGFRMVVEAGLGLNNVAPGETTIDVDALDPTRRPDLQVVCSRDLGDASDVTCDAFGVPGVPAPHFDASQRTSNAINDLGCHFEAFTSAAFGCTINQFGNPSFVSPTTRLQFCLLVNRNIEFGEGDTLCSVQVRDRGGNLGPQAQFILRVGSGTMPATFTPTAPPTSTPIAVTRTRTPTASLRPSASNTPVPTTERSSTPTVAVTPAASATVSRSRTRAPTPTQSATITLSRTPSRSPTPAATASATRTATRVPGQGPVITFFGLARADDLLIQPIGTTTDGVKIYNPPVPLGIRIVVEARRGPSGEFPGVATYLGDPSFPPDLQVLSSRPLGDGSGEVCDREGSAAGGVPAVNPPVFSDDEDTLAAISDFACRFLDGGGAPQGRVDADDSCVASAGGVFGFVDHSPPPFGSVIQFCAQVDRFFCFPPGDTTLVVRVRDELFNDGPPARIIVRNSQTAVSCP